MHSVSSLKKVSPASLPSSNPVLVRGILQILPGQRPKHTLLRDKPDKTVFKAAAESTGSGAQDQGAGDGGAGGASDADVEGRGAGDQGADQERGAGGDESEAGEGRGEDGDEDGDEGGGYADRISNEFPAHA